MKNILLILLVSGYLSLQAQPAKVIAVYSGSIILAAAGDALNNSHEKGWGHLCNAASAGLLVVSPFIIKYEKSKWLYYLATYTSLRIAMFDCSYNTTRGLPLNYVGTTSTWDKVQKKNPVDPIISKSVFLSLGIAIPLYKLNGDEKTSHRFKDQNVIH